MIFDQKDKVITVEAAVIFVNLKITLNTTDNLIGKSSDRLHVMLNDISVLRYSAYQVKRELQFQGLLISH